MGYLFCCNVSLGSVFLFYFVMFVSFVGLSVSDCHGLCVSFIVLASFSSLFDQ